MKALFIAGREPSYVRNVMLLKALELQGIETVECTDSSSTYLRRFPRVLAKFLRSSSRDVDAVLVGFFGQPLVVLVKGLLRKPLVFDAFLSAYETLCFERRQFTPGSMVGRFAYHLDRASCQASDVVLLDTHAHIEYFASTFRLPREKFRRLLVGADESVFYPRPAVGKREGVFSVFYYATMLPLHGTEFILEAAQRLRAESNVQIQIIGRGREQPKLKALAERLALDNVRFRDWIPFGDLPDEIARADVCLGGHFSSFEKAKRVIAGKTYQFIAMKKPVILGDCEGNRELFEHENNALFVTMASGQALAEGILRLRDDAVLRERIAENGYRTFLEHGTTGAIARALASAMEAL
jgi:glycosyltransferase involved in cell wall biosynthesis